MKISTLLLAGVGAFCCTSTMAQTSSDPSVGDQITEVANITPSTVAYRIKGARGYLFSQSETATKLSSNYLKKDQYNFTIPKDNVNDPNFNFVLIPSELQTNGYYIYNVSTNKFVGKTSTAEADLLSLVETPNLDNCVWKFRKSEHTQSNIDEYNRYDGTFPFSITNGNYYLTISDASMAGVKTYSNVDAGSRFQLIVADNTTNFTAACEKVKVYETQTRKEQIKSLVESHVGELGYPTREAWNTYTEAVANAQQVSVVNTALETMLAVNNLVYLTDGKAYYIRPVNRGATNRSANRLYCGTDNTLSIGVGNSDDASAIFYCHKVGEHKYIFTNNAGKYMRFRADTKSFNGDASGFSDAYGNEQIFTFYPMQNVTTDTEVYIGSGTITKGDLNQLGLFLLQGQLESGRSAQHYLMANTNDKKFHNGGETVIYYTASNNTCAFYLEPALQQNKIKTNALTVGTVRANIATYSSPFPVNLPEGVDAYIAKQEGENNVVLQKITGALPANTGVILSSETTNEYIPTARTTEALATVNAADNKLVATTGNAVPADVTAYILGKDNNNNSKAVFKKLSSNALNRTIAQYKAYLTLDGAQSAQLMNFAFAGSDLTGIQNVTETSAKSKTAYDLAGRKVGKLQKGIYIVNGKKVIVK